jgi:hypothetical protein
MSIRAGSIINVGGRNVVDRLQTAGLDDPRVPVETIREVGNDLAVDKIPTEAEFTYRMESWDVSTDMMAFLHGLVGTQIADEPPGDANPLGTEYDWQGCEHVHIVSPWKRNTGDQGGDIAAGLIIPNYYPTRLRYRFGVTDWAVQEVELAGGAFYYAEASPVEVTADGDGIVAAFTTPDDAIPHRVGGGGGTTFRYVLGVLVDGVPQIEGYDYDESVPVAGDPGVATITFRAGHIPPVGTNNVRFVYFSDTPRAYPQAVHADTLVKPGAVRGRHIDILLGTPAVDEIKMPGVQTFELEATVNSETDREMGTEGTVGRAINSFDANGTVTFRPRDIPTLFDILSRITGVARDEVFGYLNENSIPLRAQIRNPKNPGEVLKTLDVGDAVFSMPGNAARVNTTQDFALRYESKQGTFKEVKGAI